MWSTMKPLVLLLLLSSCAPRDPQTAASGETQAPGEPGAAVDTATADGGTTVTAEETPGWLLALAAQQAADDVWPDGRVIGGAISLSNAKMLYLLGDPPVVHALLEGAPDAAVSAVVIDGANPTAPCVGILESAPDFVAFSQGGTASTLSWTSDNAVIDSVGHAAPLSACGTKQVSLEDLRSAEELRNELAEEGQSWDGDGAVPPPSACSATTCSVACGSDDGSSFAGQEAYSNGSYTGTGCGCYGTYSGTTDSDRNQCTHFVDRVHGHYGATTTASNWTGAAYSGYWTSTSAGPYVKGMVPFGSGTSYDAPLTGDVAVWSGGTYGHVGIVATVGSSSLTIYDQNRRCGDQSCNLSYSSSSSRYTLSNGTAAGYCGAESISSYTPVGYLRHGWDFCSTYGLASSSSSSNWWPNDASYVSGTVTGSSTDISDYITINPGTSDPYLTSPTLLAIPAYSSSVTYGYRYFRVYLRSNCSNKSAQLFWRRTTDSAFSSTRSVNATISGTGWQTLTFDLTTNTSWSGTIDQIRIDPASSCSSASTDTIELQYAYFDR
jgi:hypothetical protein